MEGDETQDDENTNTYVVAIHYLDDRDSENIENLSKDVAKIIVNNLKTEVEAKKEWATIEVDKKDFYIFRMINIKDINSIDVDEE